MSGKTQLEDLCDVMAGVADAETVERVKEEMALANAGSGEPYRIFEPGWRPGELRIDYLALLESLLQYEAEKTEEQVDEEPPVTP